MTNKKSLNKCSLLNLARGVIKTIKENNIISNIFYWSERTNIMVFKKEKRDDKNHGKKSPRIA